MKAELGFEYTEALCQAIEAYTRHMEGSNPGGFVYRGANLKYAVQRDLYFSFINNQQLYTLFTQCILGKPLNINEVPNELARNLAFYLLCGICLPPSCSQKRPPYQIQPVDLVRRLHRWIREWVHTLLSQSSAMPMPSEQEATILIHVIHEKFVRYLRPIMDCLPVPFAYLLALDLNLKPYLTQQGLPFIDCSGLPKLSARQQLRGVLTHFRHLTAYYDQFYASLTHLKPQCVILAEGNAPQDEIINQACQQLSIPVICFQQGWSPIVHNGFRNMSYTKMLVWGEGFSELLQPYNPDQKFAVVGSHVLEPRTIATRLSHVDGRKAVCCFLQAPTRLISQECWDEFLKLVKWVASEFAEIPILVREHPSYSLSSKECTELGKFPNIHLTPPGDYSLAEILNVSYLTISIYSSTILESIAAGVVPLIFNTTSLPTYFPDVQAAGAGIEVKSLEAAMQIIRRILQDPSSVQRFKPALEKFRAKFFNGDDKNSTDRIIEEIMAVCGI